MGIRLFIVIFLLFAQAAAAPAKELSFYEEYVPEFSAGTDSRPEQTEQAEQKGKSVQAGNTAVQNKFSAAEPGESNEADTQNAAEDLRGVQDRQADTAQTVRHFFLTDEKHGRFLLESEEYALADAMLNQTWRQLVKKLDKKAYRQLWKNHKLWLAAERDTAANSFLEKVPDIPEEYAYMLVAAAKTQELAQKLWRAPAAGEYRPVSGENRKDDLLVTLQREDNMFVVQGYGVLPAAAEEVSEGGNGAADRKNAADGAKQLVFRAEFPADGRLWLALTAVPGQKLFILTMENSLCLVHADNAFPLDFNGVFVK